ncbi:MAG: 50S ribosomal protein L11 methyltransferase [Bacteroidales bacterium]|nr:50S ribosomal protein L11 methyltransferase [Bacteroidales bacterium]
MKYIEVSFTMDDTGLWRDMLVDTLGNEGPYESFVETPDGLKAYVQASQYDAAWLASAVQAFPVPLRYKAEEMEDRDWNAEWEKGHEAVLVQYGDHDRKVVNAAAQDEAVRSGSIWVRAPFHPHRDDVNYELIIEPKMSFGTAHHPTTYMMLSYVAELPVNGLRVLDMGCGTAVLGILAKMRGASYVEGIDIDEWAFANARENAASNGVELTFKLGGAEAIEGSFDIILANINRNILLADMPRYAAALNPGGSLLLSGFYEADEGALIAKANTLGMTLKSKKSRDGWSALQLRVRS